MNYYQDIELKCLCGESFIWSVGEQEFLNDLAIKGKIQEVVPPKRCFVCKQKKREQQTRQESNFKKSYY